MKYSSAVLGQFEYADSEVLTFQEGLLGFEDNKQYALLGLPDQEPFMLLQSLEDEAISFVVVNPTLVVADYNPEFLAEELAVLQTTALQDIVVFAILVLDSDPANITINLRGPILINAAKNIGCQVALRDPRYFTKHYCLQELANSQQK